MDPSQDPDRYDPDAPEDWRTGPTLPELLGEGANEDPRDTHAWLVGLCAVIGFLLLVTVLAHLGGG